MDSDDVPRPPSSPDGAPAPPDYPTAADYGADGDCRRRKRVLAAIALATLLAAGGGAAACWTAYRAEIERRRPARFMLGTPAPFSLPVNAAPLSPFSPTVPERNAP